MGTDLVVSSPDDADDDTMHRCGAAIEGPRVLCFDPDPGTTKGEGRELRRLAAQYGWHTVIVVTFRPPTSRGPGSFSSSASAVTS